MLTKAHALEVGCPADLAEIIDNDTEAQVIWTAEQIAKIRAEGKRLYALSWRESMLTKAHALEVGCPADLAEIVDADPEAKAIPGLWSTLIALALKYGPQVWQIVAADLAMSKTWAQIMADLFQLVFPTIPQGPMP